MNGDRDQPNTSRHKRSRPNDTAEDTNNLQSPPPPQQRRLWAKERSSSWWEKCDSSDFSDEEFKKNFRMSKSTFNIIVGYLEASITKKDTKLRSAVPARQRVAVCIWKLATGESYLAMENYFGLAASTCHKVVQEVCMAMHDVLKPIFLIWPDEELNKVKQGFVSISGIPNVVGSLHTSHILIKAPSESKEDFINQKLSERNKKATHTICIQGVFDFKGIFTDVSVGYQGSMSNESVLEHSSLPIRQSMGLMENSILIGTYGHVLKDWVLVPYSQEPLTWAQQVFNEKLNEVQNVCKEAFMRLKARWRCLLKRSEMKLEELRFVVMACCVLHNICEMHHEELSDDLKIEIDDDETVAHNNGDGVISESALAYRDHIVEDLFNPF